MRLGIAVLRSDDVAGGGRIMAHPQCSAVSTSVNAGSKVREERRRRVEERVIEWTWVREMR